MKVFYFFKNPCDKQGYCYRVLDFFPVKKLFFSRLDIVNLVSAHYEFSFFCISGTFGLEVKNTLEKILASNLTGYVFFFVSNGKFSISKKCQLIICLLMFCRLSCHIIVFFAVRKLHCSCF